MPLTRIEQTRARLPGATTGRKVFDNEELRRGSEVTFSIEAYSLGAVTGLIVGPPFLGLVFAGEGKRGGGWFVGLLRGGDA